MFYMHGEQYELIQISDERFGVRIAFTRVDMYCIVRVEKRRPNCYRLLEFVTFVALLRDAH